MIQSMTGFASREAKIEPFGKASIELRSSNHKFLESVFHLPDGFLVLEDRIKKALESKIKRGRVTCVLNLAGSQGQGVFINKGLLRSYLASLKKIKQEYKLQDDLSLNTLIHLPGVLSLEESKSSPLSVWPRLKVLVDGAVDDLVKMRVKEGKALLVFLRNRAERLHSDLENIKQRFKRAIKEKLDKMNTPEERSSFLKDSDISEEIERLEFHIRNFRAKLKKSGPIGKELDFIAQEMQREANTLAAKSFDTLVSARVVQMKSQIEKIREQVQNIE